MGGGAIGAPFARLFANLIVMGSGVMGRAFLTAYKEALANGGAVAGAKKALQRAGGMAEQEARMILNVTPKASEAEVAEAHERLVAMNDPAKGGSKYLQTKIANAHDALRSEQPADGAASGGQEKSSQ